MITMKNRILRDPVAGDFFYRVYGGDERVVRRQARRFENLLKKFKKNFGPVANGGIHLFSVPGRTEIGGNHTDHNHGRVLAAAIDLDAIAAAGKVPRSNIVIYSAGYDHPFTVDISELPARKEERRTTQALIRGIAARLRELGYSIGGFNACIASDVLPGSGLSSSAVIEVLIADILNTLYNDGKIDEETIALCGQFAENNYFDKPCGLMDQSTCAKGGIITIDFEIPQAPRIKKVNFDFSAKDFSILVVNAGGSHADLTDDYAAVPTEMKAVARACGRNVCREIEYADIMRRIHTLRSTVGDRAILRALHFLEENKRVENQAAALEKDDFDLFLELVQESGNSSLRWLQNCYSPGDTAHQGIMLALALTEKFIEQNGPGACRVHGGGFAGTIQVFLPNHATTDYIRSMEPVFGKDCVTVLNIRAPGFQHTDAGLE